MTEIRLGTQGWNYAAWVGPLYPSGTRAGDFLKLYARAFPTVEVDSTFYAVPSERTVRGWAERTPPGFRFALKLPREVTHERRLRDADDVLDAFFGRARLLGEKLGPVLVQFGPDFSPAERPALERFLPRLPRDLQIAVEFRQHAWVGEETLALLQRHGVALALSDGRWIPRRWLLTLLQRPTAPFHYLRWMGPDRSLTDFSHVQVDRSGILAAWADALGALPPLVTQVFGYVNNHFAGHSPASARELQQRLGLGAVPPGELGEQAELF